VFDVPIEPLAVERTQTFAARAAMIWSRVGTPALTTTIVTR
jgi:hypothetical protein